jgi:DNA primase
MTIFEEVKELVDVPTAARHYGVEVHQGNMALCPFHRERHPSCKLYADHYYCFGCQAHGDVIKLVQELFGLKPIEAVKQINSDFALGLDVDKPPDMAAVNRRKQEIARQKAEQANMERMYGILLRYYTLLDRYKMQYAPKAPDDEIDGRYVYAVHHIEYAWYLLETFNRTDAAEQLEIKTEVDRIEREYKRILDEWGE